MLKIRSKRNRLSHHFMHAGEVCAAGQVHTEAVDSLQTVQGHFVKIFKVLPA